MLIYVDYRMGSYYNITTYRIIGAQQEPMMHHSTQNQGLQERQFARYGTLICSSYAICKTSDMFNLTWNFLARLA